jgi:transposase
MRDVELYRHLLGLEAPWTVRPVELNIQGQRVDVWAGHAADGRWPCPECGTTLGLYVPVLRQNLVRRTSG